MSARSRRKRWASSARTSLRRIRRLRSSCVARWPSAARTLVETIGPSAAQLVGAVQQLADAFPAQRIGPAEIHRQFRGLGEQKTWDLCDKAFGKDLPGAIRALRSIEAGGDEALMVLGGIAARLRDLIRVRSVSAGDVVMPALITAIAA